MNHGEIIPTLLAARAPADPARRRDRILGVLLWMGFLALLFGR